MRTAGIEPAISGMSRRRSSTELRAHRSGIEPPVGIEPTPAVYGTATRPSCCGGLVERTAGFEPAWISSETKRRTQRPRPHRAPGWTRTNTLPGKNRLLCIGATEARIARHRSPRASWYSIVMPRHTVSLSFRCELALGEPSIHLCFSRLRFGLRESNSHDQVQSLASCHWTKPECCRSGETRTLTSRSKNPVRCQLRHRSRSIP